MTRVPTNEPPPPRAFGWRLIYAFASTVAMPIVWLRLFWRARRLPALREGWRERAGRLPPTVLAASRGGLWVHAVSAGETITVAPLIADLREQLPDLPILFTTTTHTGRERARALLPATGVAIAYAPYDFAWTVRRFVRALRPRAALFVETELWPHTIEALRDNGARIALVNGRLSARSASRYARVRTLAARMLASFDLVAVQFASHAERFRALGARDVALRVLGSAKFDAAAAQVSNAPPLPAPFVAQLAARPVWIAGSTHPGEDALVLRAHERVRARVPDAVLLLVPRHPERAADVLRLCGTLGAERTSAYTNASGALPDVLVGDRMGELVALYRCARVAFVGGSLVPVGGHTPVEPVLAGAAVITGPYVRNFEDIYAALFECGGATRVEDADRLAEEVCAQLLDDERRARGVAAAQACVAMQRGATARQIEALVAMLSAGPARVR